MTMPATWPSWTRALSEPAVRRRALVIGATVGVAQVLINQGDVWVAHVAHRQMVAASVVVKTLVSPLVTVAVAWLSAAWAWAEREQ
jgi:hypothetical protein